MPSDFSTIKAFEISFDEMYETRSVIKESFINNNIEITPKVGDYIVCCYSDQKWVTFVSYYDVEFDDY